MPLNKYLRALFSSLLFLISALSTLAQSPKLFTSSHDMSSSLINSVCQDSNGMIWVATEDGLNRYDGSKITIYKNIPGDSTSLAHNYVNSLFEDDKGHLFVATGAGIQLYMPDRDNFSTVAVEENPSDNGFMAIRRVIQRADGTLICVGNVLREIVISCDETKIFYRRIKLSSQFDLIHDICEDKEGNLWLSKEDGGVFRVNPKGKITKFLGKSGDPVVTCMATTDSGEVYFGTPHKGILRYNKTAGQLVPFVSFPDNYTPLRSIVPDKNRQLYVAFDGNGVMTCDALTGYTKPLTIDLLDLSTKKAHSLIIDDAGNLWVGLYQKGLLMIPTHKNPFKYIGSKSVLTDCIGNSCINSILQDGERNLWVATDNEGVYKLNSHGAEHYKATLPLLIINLFEDSQGNLWIGSFDKGAGWLNKKTGQFEPLTLLDEEKRAVQHIYGFTEGPDGKVWIASMGAGIYCYDPKSRTVKPLKGYSEKWICSILISKDGKKLYAGSYSGLHIIDLKTMKAKQLASDVFINAITEDEDGTLWLATSGGLLKVSSDNKVSMYDTTNGLPSISVYSVVNVGEYLWISTNQGLSRMHKSDAVFSNFYEEDGLQGNEFYKNSSFRGDDGVIYFGGTEGITYFNPADISKEGLKWTVRVSDFYVHGKAVRAGMKSGSRDIIDCPIFNAKKFKLSHDDNSFTIEFGTRELNGGRRVDYKYHLDDDKWELLPHGSNRINFSNIKSGKHKLYIKAVDHGIESEQTVIVIDIAPAWYASWWAKLVYIAMAIMIGYYVYNQQRLRNERKRAALQQAHEREISEAKLQFFTNISHDIRTPMTLVLNMIQKLMSSDDDANRQSSYKIISRNAHRILRLGNEMLDMRKIEKNQMKMAFQKTDIIGFISDLVETYDQACVSRELDLTFSHEGFENLDVWIDLSNFDKIMMNLMSNAVKYTPKGGNINISVSTGHDEQAPTVALADYVEVDVTDDGIGIPDDEKKMIFERFYQVSNNNIGGCGVGLHLAYLLVKLHYGTITVQDNPSGQGTRFVLRIPMGNAHLTAEQMKENQERMSSESKSYEMMALDNTPQFEIPSVKISRNERVLIVEDDLEIGQYLQHEFSAKYRTYLVANGKEALEYMFKQPVDIVISDVMMPEMDGLTLTSKIKKNINLNHIPVILLTAKSSEEDEMSGLEIGADAYVSKPFNIELLMIRVEGLLQSHRRLKNAFAGTQNQEDKLAEINVQSADERFMERLMRVINKNMNDPEFQVDELATTFGISRAHLHRKLRELTNQTTRDFLRNLRLKEGARLLVEKNLTVSEVSLLVGFKNASTFTTCFKNLYGVSPKTYVEQQGKVSEPVTQENTTED
jgi:signal transduction histidine kinase/ligand-binding sensor domain-containing protein/DNA-binding response OmpR family regulator